jgi:hypothetical protein
MREYSGSDQGNKIDYKGHEHEHQYQCDRVNSYPSVSDQLDEIYHNGINAWKAVIKVTKDKYPKG